ncbi:MAG: porin, partial [Alphaproteobacteria bacterium]
MPSLHRPRLACTVLASLLLVASARAQSSIEERLQRLEQEVGTLRQENAELRRELGVESRAGQLDVKPAGQEPSLSVGGLIQAQTELGEKGDSRFITGNNRFYLRRARINATGRFLEDFDFRVELEAGAGSLTEAVGNTQRAQLADAFISWHHYPAANLKIGQFKTPFGYEQLLGDSRQYTIERSLAGDRLTLGRQIGVQVGGDLFDQRISYATGLFNGTGVNTNANDNDRFLWAGRVTGTAWSGRLLGQDARWTVGTDAYVSDDTNLAGLPAEFGFDSVPGGPKDGVFTGSRFGRSISTQLHLGPFDLLTEYLDVRFRPADTIPFATFHADGWYAQAAYFIVPRFVQTAVKYEQFDADDRLGGDSTRTWTLGLNWFLKDNDLKLQFDW